MASPERYRVYAMLNFVGLPLTRLLGYTPGWGGLGQDLPKGVFEQWVGWVMSERYLFTDPNCPAPVEFRQLQGRAARAVPGRRSLGDAAGGRIAVFGISAIEPEILTITPADVGVAKSGISDFSPRTPRHAVAGCRGMDPGVAAPTLYRPVGHTRCGSPARHHAEGSEATVAALTALAKSVVNIEAEADL